MRSAYSAIRDISKEFFYVTVPVICLAAVINGCPGKSEPPKPENFNERSVQVETNGGKVILEDLDGDNRVDIIYAPNDLVGWVASGYENRRRLVTTYPMSLELRDAASEVLVDHNTMNFEFANSRFKSK